MSINFKIEESRLIKGIWIIKPSLSNDLRGTIWTSFLKNEIESLLPNGLFFKHDKFSDSKRNVLRGIHGDTKSWKLVTCVFGEIQQVVVDCRESSPTKNCYQSFTITSSSPMLVLLPPGMGNSFLVKSEIAVYHYKLAYDGEYIDADEQFSYTWNSPEFNINWDIDNPILSERDARK